MAQIKVYIDPREPHADAYRAALITHPAKFVIVESPSQSDVFAHDMMPSGTFATWTTSYFVADAQIDSSDLTDKVIEISIESPSAQTPEERIAEIGSVFGALGIQVLTGRAVSKTANSVMVAGNYLGSAVSAASRLALEPRLQITITDAKLQVTLDAPLGGTAMAAEISGHDREGTHKLRPLYRSVISRWLANYQL
jgi:hypothetical protein